MPLVSFNIGAKLAQAIADRYNLQGTPPEKLAQINDIVKQNLREEMMNWYVNSPASQANQELEAERQRRRDELRSET